MFLILFCLNFMIININNSHLDNCERIIDIYVSIYSYWNILLLIFFVFVNIIYYCLL
jgi:hypothetical protein